MMGDYWNYVDVLAYALALHEPKTQGRFTGDPVEWHQAVYELKESFADRLPDAFKHISFDTKPGLPPFSPQVDHFLHVLAQARLMSAPNPAYRVFEMSAAQKAAVSRLNVERLKAHQELLGEMGARLVASLGQ